MTDITFTRERLSSLVGYTIRTITNYKNELDEVIDKLACLTDVSLHGNDALAATAGYHLHRICEHTGDDETGSRIHRDRLLADMLRDLLLLIAPAE